MSIRVTNVTKRWGRTLGLSDVSLDVRAGDVYGFIGHNGSGKTTLLRTIAGLQPPLSGQIDGAEDRIAYAAHSSTMVPAPVFEIGI